MRELEEMKKEYSGNKLYNKDLDMDKTAIIVVDMINGFVKEGNLASPRVDDMSPNIKELLNKFKDSRKVFFRDVHTSESKELASYAEHCVKESETQVIDLLKEYLNQENTVQIKKNSTNGFITEEFGKWFDSNEDINTFIVVGCVTDICVSDFARALQCFICEHDLDKDVIVPVNCVETYDYGTHNGDIMNIVSLYSMKLAGIKIVDEII